MAALALAVTAAIAAVAVGFLSAIPWTQENLSWCRSLTRTHHKVPAWLGVPASAALVVMAGAAVRAYYGARRTLWAAQPPGTDLRIVDDDWPEAYALGGKHGHIVVSAGMLRVLDGAERRVLLAHERSHLKHRHHRYLALALVSSAGVPLLGFVARRLRFAVERWADEDAATEVGDRRLVALAIVRAALARSDYEAGPALLGLGDFGVRARVDALLLSPPPLGGAPVRSVVTAPHAVGAVLGSTLQFDHFWTFLFHVCGLR